MTRPPPKSTLSPSTPLSRSQSAGGGGPRRSRRAYEGAVTDSIADRLTELEAAVRRAAEAVARLREDNDRLRRDNRRLEDERRQVLGQIDAVLRDIAKLDLGAET